MVTASADMKIRVFTVDESRKAGKKEQEAFDQEGKLALTAKAGLSQV